ncbi:MAG: cellulase family glycosylhydrolase, partial [Bacilli bacterium]|nr:cellulase family glycosylhydrolase [Bacilli bacterium]
MIELVDKTNKCWPKEKAWDWYNKHDYIIGVNYNPRYAVNSTEFWQKATFDIEIIKQELSWAKQYGYNSVRVFLQYLLWENDSIIFKKHFSQFLECAASLNISVTPVLFDDCAFAGLEPYLGKQSPPKPLLHNSGWTPSPGEKYTNNLNTYNLLRAYVEDIVFSFKNDKRILMWDLYNEPGNSKRGSKSLYLLEKAFEWARACRPNQPLTAGFWGVLNGAAVNDTYFVDLKALELSDIITFHHYADEIATKKTISILQELDYPIICTEWLARVFFNSRVDNILLLFDELNVG